MEYHLHHQEQDLAGVVDVGASGGGGGGERLPQWSPVETREFLSIRADLDQCFAETKRNKRLWEEISSRMLSKGFYRTPEQCKSKWKNLLTRFKGSEAMDDEERSRQTFPYYEEMKSIYSRRVQRLHSMEKEKGVLDPEEIEEEEDDDDGRMKKKRKRKSGRTEGEERGRVLEELSRALKELARRQKEREERWLQAAERRDAERREAEFEMRRVMEGIHEERVAMEKRWREREEERWARQEVRAERRDRIIATIFARLDGDNGD